MIRFIGIATVLLVSALSGSAVALEGPHGEKKMVVGGNIDFGFSMIAGDGYEEIYLQDRDDRTAKFAVGGNVYFDYYLNSYLGIEAGIGFVTKGIRFSRGDYRRKTALTYMEIPVCAKLDYRHFQASVGFALFVALSGYNATKDGDDEFKERWNDDDWDYVNRANFGPKLAVSYAVPVGPVFVVPGLAWSMHLINDIDNDEVPGDGTHNMRANNLLFTAGVEWGF